VSDFPYTDEQARMFADALWGHSTSHARADLEQLTAAGITVTFPEPRYYVDGSSHFYAHVMERGADGIAVAAFNRVRHPDAQRAAQAEADRLNREAS
jgi:hypothetical protein